MLLRCKSLEPPMSQLGQKCLIGLECNISASPPKSRHRAVDHCRLVPRFSAANCSLFDHLVGAARSAGGTVRPGAPGSIRLYACKLKHPGPFIDFMCNHVSKLGG
jgi:hypothetical protein